MYEDGIGNWNYANVNFPNIVPCESSGDYEEKSIAEHLLDKVCDEGGDINDND